MTTQSARHVPYRAPSVTLTERTALITRVRALDLVTLPLPPRLCLRGSAACLCLRGSTSVTTTLPPPLSFCVHLPGSTSTSPALPLPPWLCLHCSTSTSPALPPPPWLCLHRSRSTSASVTTSAALPLPPPLYLHLLRPASTTTTLPPPPSLYLQPHHSTRLRSCPLSATPVLDIKRPCAVALTVCKRSRSAGHTPGPLARGVGRTCLHVLSGTLSGAVVRGERLKGRFCPRQGNPMAVQGYALCMMQ